MISHQVCLLSNQLFHILFVGATKFTAINLSLAISSIRENMGLILAALQVCGIGFLWVLIVAIACVNAYKMYNSWTILFFIFSFYWTQQVLSNVVSVATAGNIGRWFVMGESTPDLNSGLRVRRFNICFGYWHFCCN